MMVLVVEVQGNTGCSIPNSSTVPTSSAEHSSPATDSWQQLITLQVNCIQCWGQTPAEKMECVEVRANWVC